ncbi:hypothetical protein LTR37_021326 [Vermiconidia calcicola]|uniref:Uncharacterized protein n=1 Tax=Vermiconidia calcicola TaxID=1690605 RepID=A0ACC3M8V5_9PEZI|nr:hypothetical protein LTR37_021326 [Vermiconidia calcicola]
MPPKQAHQQQQESDLSEEDKKILEDAHTNRNNPEHPAHEKHPEHAKILKSIPKRLGGAAIFGAGATVGGQAVHALGG